MAVHPCPLVLLTRPRAASERFAKGIKGAQIVIAPLMEITATGAHAPHDGVTGLIVTSQNAVPFLPPLEVPAYCVGSATARAVGERAILVGPDANGLVDGLLAKPPAGMLLHCHGTHVRGNVVGRLAAGGVRAIGVAVYEQGAVSPSAEFHEATTQQHLVVPLFSPRSATLFASAAPELSPDAQVIAMSKAVTDALPEAFDAITVACPDGRHMKEAVQSAVARRKRP